uniref:hypothetical protein n=1 Tax=uncultured Ruminococcus sp. TaxID=165186 RepID=UPI00292E28EA
MRKFISVLLALMLVLSLTTVGFSAVIYKGDGTVSAYNVVDDIAFSIADVMEEMAFDAEDTQTVYFMMPNGHNGDLGTDGSYAPSWNNQYNLKDGVHYAGIYFWQGPAGYTPGGETGYNATHTEGVNQRDWPGYRAELVDPDQNIFKATVHLDSINIIWNNGIDGGKPEVIPEDPEDIYYKAAQTRNIKTEGCAEEDDENPKLPEGSPDFDTSFDGCIYIVDPDQIDISEYSGMQQCGGNWYVYYGDGCYGMYSTESDNFKSIEENCCNPAHFDASGAHVGYVPEEPTEAVVPTEAPTEPETEAPTEPETEAPTEPETEAPTEAPQPEDTYIAAGVENVFGTKWNGNDV